MGLLDVLFQKFNVKATNLSQVLFGPSSSIGPNFEDVAPKQSRKFVTIEFFKFGIVSKSSS